MRMKNDLKLRRVGRKYMVVELSEQEVNLTNVYTMNETAASLWNKFRGVDFTEDELVKFLCDEYEVTEEQASADVEVLVKDWMEYGLVQ